MFDLGSRRRAMSIAGIPKSHRGQTSIVTGQHGMEKKRGMMTDPEKYIRSQSYISAGIHVIMNTVMTFVVLGGESAVPIWGIGGVAFDLVPTTFMCILMAAWVPGLLTMRLVRAGALRPAGRGAVLLLENAFLRANMAALAATALLNSLFVLIFDLAGMTTVGFWTLLACTAMLGILLGLTIAPLAVRQTLARG